jgi:hypothetical protein
MIFHVMIRARTHSHASYSIEAKNLEEAEAIAAADLASGFEAIPLGYEPTYEFSGHEITSIEED